MKRNPHAVGGTDVQHSGAVMPRLKDIDFHLFIESLLRTIELKDMYTAGHSRRVSEITEQLCLDCGMSEADCEYLHVVGHVHDIGKIGIADGILMKSGQPTPAEYQLIQQHTVIGASIFENLPGLDRMARIIRHHHERYDGKGYPDGLKGDAIPLESAIIAVADSFDAMTTYRSYKAALTLERARDEMRRNRGTQFHPGICDLFLDLLERHPDGLQCRPCRISETLLRRTPEDCTCAVATFFPPPLPLFCTAQADRGMSSPLANSR